MSENKFMELVGLMNTAGTEAMKFYDKGNKSAGVRLRKFRQDVKKLAQDVREEVLEKSK